MQQRRPVVVTVVSVESPPGGGKGFLLKYLAAKGLVSPTLVGHVVLQPDAIGHIMDMRTDTARWAFFTELFFLCTHVTSYKQALANITANNHNNNNTSSAAAAAPQQQHHVLLLEGSPVTDKLCYFEQQHRANMHPLEAELYEEWSHKLQPYWHVDHHILLLSDMHAHVERIVDNSKVEQAHLGLDEVHGLIKTFVHALPGAYIVPCPPNFEDNEPVLDNLRTTLVNVLMQCNAT